MLGFESISEIQQWIATYGLWVVFVALMLENVLFISMIVPGLFVIIAAGYAASHDAFSLGAVVVVGVIGVWLGDTLNYLIGRYLWYRLLTRFDRANKGLNRARAILDQRGSAVFVIYHFDPIVRMIGAAAVGTAKVPLRRWMPFDYFGAVLWVTLYGMAGYALGRLSRDIEDWRVLQPVQIAAFVLIIGWIILIGRATRRMLNTSDESINI